MKDLTEIDFSRMFRIERGSDKRWCVVTCILGILVDPVTLKAARIKSPASGLTRGQAVQVCTELETWYTGQPSVVSKQEERKAKH